MKIEYKPVHKEVTQSTENIPIGTVFSGRLLPQAENNLWLRTCGHIVVLDRSLFHIRKVEEHIMVYDYRKRKATLVVED
jgi:hypothetical protein